MNIQPDQIVFPTNRSTELHMFGQYVSVCWNIVTRTTVRLENGARLVENLTRRVGHPYLNLIMVRSDSEGDYVDDDSPGAGGFTASFARGIATDLVRAAEYMEQVDG
jgi:hypothetical protein